MALSPASSFQSAPPAEARGDRFSSGENRLAARGSKGFNPLPLPKQGEIPSSRRPCARISIRSPCRSKGRCTFSDEHLSGSIRSPCRSKGRLRMNHVARAFSGDVSIRSPCRSKGRFNHPLVGATRELQVSIRSPCRSKGRSVISQDAAVTVGWMFQSAPPAEARGDIFPRLASGQIKFQSAPPAEARGDPLDRRFYRSR